MIQAFALRGMPLYESFFCVHHQHRRQLAIRGPRKDIAGTQLRLHNLNQSVGCLDAQLDRGTLNVQHQQIRLNIESAAFPHPRLIQLAENRLFAIKRAPSS